MTNKKRILIAPLDWGLGHATRCIPIIRFLLLNNAEVIIAADKRPLQLLKNEFPDLEFVVLVGYNIHYPKNGNMILHMFCQIPKLFLAIKREHKQLGKIIRDKKIDAVISDNRYGLWSNIIPCIFITHQLYIKSPIAQNILHKLNTRYIAKYTECWVPDREAEFNLSGELSHKINSSLPNTYFIGPLSRMVNAIETKKSYDILVLLSGPEPQRSIFERIILKELDTTTLKCIVVQGIPEKNETKKIKDTIEMFSHLDSEELNKVILTSNLIISRPGYSTIMDLAILGKKAIFVPTPGQTEQEYLARKFKQEKICFSMPQNKFSLTEALRESENFKGFTSVNCHSINFENRLKKVLE